MVKERKEKMKKFGKVVLGSMLALGGLLSNVAVSSLKQNMA